MEREILCQRRRPHADGDPGLVGSGGAGRGGFAYRIPKKPEGYEGAAIEGEATAIAEETVAAEDGTTALYMEPVPTRPSTH